MSLIFATGNEKKLEQARDFLSPEILITGESVDLMEPQTTSLQDIAQSKILEAYERVKAPVIIDDTGVYIDGYSDFPGTFAKFAFHQLGNNGLHKIAPAGTTGSIQCIVSYMGPELDEPIFFHGIVRGRWDFSQEFDTHYQSVMYDCFFYPDATNSGDMSVRVIDDFDNWKLDYSHRAIAVSQLKNYLLNEKGGI